MIKWLVILLVLSLIDILLVGFDLIEDGRHFDWSCTYVVAVLVAVPLWWIFF